MSFDALFSTSICYGSGSPEAGWTLALPITLPLAAIAVLYALGATRLWRRSSRGRRLRLWQALLFGAGWATLAIALVSPLHALGERVFTAHMIEHELLMAVAAPLLAASFPAAALMWALPVPCRQALGAAGHTAMLRTLWAALTRPAVATVLQGVVIWIWHVPALFQAALERGVLHYAQHASFLGAGLLFWLVLLPRPGREPAFGSAVMHLFFTSLHTGLLGVRLLVSPRRKTPSAPACATSPRLRINNSPVW